MTTHMFLLYGQGGEAVDAVLSGDGLGYIQKLLQVMPNVLVHDPKLVRAPPPKQLKALKGAYNWDSGMAIAEAIRELPKDDQVGMIGVSLGACEIPYIAYLTRSFRDIDLLVGIQPSYFGRHNRVPSNVRRAVCIYNPIWFITGGFGYYQWERTLGNERTKLILLKSYWPHPGDNNEGVRRRVLDEVGALAGL